MSEPYRKRINSCRLSTILVLLAVLLMSGCSSNLESNRAKPDLNNGSTEVTGKPEGLATAEVTRVIDGDTLQVELNGALERVRMIGVDTPETVHPTLGEEPYGKEASLFTKEQLTGKTVQLEFDVEERDQYGRLLAYVWLDNEMFNRILLQQGYAQTATYPPNVKYVDYFKADQKQAREMDLGLWSLEDDRTDSTASQLIGNRNTKKYHLPGCQSVGSMKESNKISFPSENEAREAGYEPCGQCRP